jgi:hypothetical protein
MLLWLQVHGTCLGMETLAIIISQNYTILGDYDAEDAGEGGPAPPVLQRVAGGSR